MGTVPAKSLSAEEVESLRQENERLRSINARLREELERLAEAQRKLVKAHTDLEATFRRLAGKDRDKPA